MTRSEFVMMACAMGIRSVENPTERARHVERLKATAEAAADALGLGEDGGQDREKRLEALVADRDSQIAGMATERDLLRCRVRELEEQLEQATAPPAAKPVRAGRGG